MPAKSASRRPGSSGTDGQLALPVGRPPAPAKAGGPNGHPKNGSAVYDESKVKTLSSLEHIRLRTGMYIGRLGDGKDFDDGIYVLVKEVVDNAVDEYIMGAGRKIDVTVTEGRVSVRDYGRGIPLGSVVDCVSVINTGAKYNDDVFQFSVGLNGVGSKAVNALSSEFRVVAYREGKYAEAV
jgi:topoisomerase-4 subunit B